MGRRRWSIHHLFNRPVYHRQLLGLWRTDVGSGVRAFWMAAIGPSVRLAFLAWLIIDRLSAGQATAHGE